MELNAFESVNLEVPHEHCSPSTDQVAERDSGLDSLLTDVEVAETLGLTTEWVRAHATEIPGFRQLGMYYRFHRTPFYQWLSGADPLLLPQQVADLLKVPRSWVYANGEQIPGYLRLGRYVRFRPVMIRQFLGGSESCQ